MTLRICLAAVLFATTALASNKVADQALDAYRAKDFGRSADLFAAAISDGGADDGTLHYNGACAAALASRKAQALAWLERAIALGGVGAPHLKADSDLASLHEEPRWKALVAAAEKVTAQRERMWNSPALATGWRETLTEDERVAGLSKVWAETKFNFANFDLVPELDWDATYLQFLPRVRAAADTVTYYRELQRFIAQLHDGHSNVYPPPEAVDLAYAVPGLSTLYLQGRVIVRSVFDPRLQKLGIVPGWEIVTVEGQPVATWAQEKVVPYISCSTEQDKLSRTYERFLLAGDAAAAVKVGFLDARGAKHELAVPRLPKKERDALAPNGAPFEWKLLPGNIALVELRSFGDDRAAAAFEANFEEIAKASAIIFDLRENGGGNSGVGQRILTSLTDKPFRTTAWRTRDYRPAVRAWGGGEGTWNNAPNELAPSGARHYAKPVVVLISARTYSAAEDFAAVFDIMKRGRIVGEPSGGSTGQPLSIRLPGGGTARICTKRDTYPDGKEYVGVGVIPQVIAKQTVADFRAGRDTVLEAALKLLR